ncbi:MAG: hypothetical protein LBQ01_04515 [Prevotellaceae bacterium]|nr:hypothetical protein [Prevotellaceae bacterium]
MDTKREKKLSKELTLKAQSLQESESRRMHSAHELSLCKAALRKQNKRQQYTDKSRDRYKEENKALRKANEKLEQENKALRKSKEKLEHEKEQLERKAEDLESQLQRRIPSESSGSPIERHKYMDFIVAICVEICVTCHCGLRTAIKILGIFKKRCPYIPLYEIPSHNSISNWIHKCGYEEYGKRGTDMPERYALIIDESMMVGSEKLMLVLGVPAEKEGEKSLTLGDAKVLYMGVRKSWTGNDIEKVLDEIKEKTGQSPVYVISDNAVTISKAVNGKGYVHVRDAGHSMALAVQHEYEKQEDFKSLMKPVADVKFKEIKQKNLPIR